MKPVTIPLSEQARTTRAAISACGAGLRTGPEWGLAQLPLQITVRPVVVTCQSPVHSRLMILSV